MIVEKEKLMKLIVQNRKIHNVFGKYPWEFQVNFFVKAVETSDFD